MERLTIWMYQLLIVHFYGCFSVAIHLADRDCLSIRRRRPVHPDHDIAHLETSATLVRAGVVRRRSLVMASRSVETKSAVNVEFPEDRVRGREDSDAGSHMSVVSMRMLQSCTYAKTIPTRRGMLATSNLAVHECFTYQEGSTPVGFSSVFGYAGRWCALCGSQHLSSMRALECSYRCAPLSV